MPVYQVMLTYLITVESEDEKDAAVAAMNLIQEHPEIYMNIYAEEVED